MASYDPEELLAWRREQAQRVRRRRGGSGPIAAYDAVEQRMLTRIERVGEEWSVVGEVTVQAEHVAVRDFSAEGDTRGRSLHIAPELSVKPVGKPGFGGRHAVLVAYPYLSDWFLSARFLESYGKREGRSGREGKEAARNDPEGIAAHMQARTARRGEAYHLHESDADVYRATFYEARRFAQFRSPKRWGTRRMTVTDHKGEAHELDVKPRWIFGLSGEHPDRVVDDLRSLEQLGELKEQAASGELFREQYADLWGIPSMPMQEETKALAEEALEASLYWSLAGPCLPPGRLEAWTKRYAGECRPLWHLVREIYVRTLYSVDKRGQRLRDKEAEAAKLVDRSPLASTTLPSDREQFDLLVDELEQTEVLLLAEDGSLTPLQYLARVEESLADQDPYEQGLACARSVAALLFRGITPADLPGRGLRQLEGDRVESVARVAQWALEAIEERGRSR